MQSCRRTSLTLIAHMVVAQCFTSLLSKLIRKSGLSAAITSRSKDSRSKALCHLRFGRKSRPTPDTAQTPLPTSDLAPLLQNIRSEIHTFAANTAVPELRIDSMGSGLIGVVDSQGVLRTERGRYDPLAGGVAPEPFGSPVDGHLADVIDLQKRIAGEK